MEQLLFSSNGQWTLVKSKENDREPTNDYDSFREIERQGSLPVDRGTRGMLHNSSNTRPPRKNSKEDMSGKVPTPTSSYDDDVNPGSPGPGQDRSKK